MNHTDKLSTTLRVVDIIDGTTVDGPGFRTSIYFAGCPHHCSECHNRSTWPADSGHDMTVRQLLDRIDRNGFNVTFSGGDPLLQASRLIPLAEAIKERGLDIWCYTGYRYETALRDSDMSALLQLADVLVDGPFIASLKSTELLFKGSSNQRLVDLRKSSADNVCIWESDF